MPCESLQAGGKELFEKDGRIVLRCCHRRRRCPDRRRWAISRDTLMVPFILDKAVVSAHTGGLSAPVPATAYDAISRLKRKPENLKADLHCPQAPCWAMAPGARSAAARRTFPTAILSKVHLGIQWELSLRFGGMRQLRKTFSPE
jgi:hypothetical protein